MKARYFLAHRSLLAAASAAFLATPALAQRVVIPARSGGTLQEGTAVTPAAPPAPVSPLGSAFSDKTGFAKVPVPTTAPGQGTVATQSIPMADPAVDPNVTAVQRVEVTPPPLDVATIKRLAQLRRELSVAESAAKARINLPADEIFAETRPAMIHPLAVPLLVDVVEYLERTLKKDVTVRAFYDPTDPAGKEIAWKRVLSLIDWLKDHSALDPDLLRASGPVPLDKAVPKAFALNIGETEFVNRLELHLE